MDNRLKKSLAKFFYKMNRINKSLAKGEPLENDLKDIGNIEDDYELIKEGLKQCEQVLSFYTSYKNDIVKEIPKIINKIEEEKNEEFNKKEPLESKLIVKNNDIKENEENNLKEEEGNKINNIKDEEEKEKIKLERVKSKEEDKDEDEDIKEEEEKKEIIKEKEGIIEKEEKLKEKDEIKNEKEKIKNEIEEKEEEHQKEEKIKRNPLKRMKTLKRLPTLSHLTDIQIGKTENVEYNIGDNIKIKVTWKYLKDSELEENIDDPEKNEKVDILFQTDYTDKLFLHWGVFKAYNEREWIHPLEECYPEFSKVFDDKAIQTEFKAGSNEDEPSIRMMLPRGKGFSNVLGGINFVIYDPINNKWYNNYRKDYQLKFKLKINKKKSMRIINETGLFVPEFARDIITCEATYGSWTLMHRYNKCSDIIDSWDTLVENDDWMWILIWLRYSYQRQLDWQRNYNTRPRDLSSSMDRLSIIVTKKFSESFKKEKSYKKLYDCQSYIIKYCLGLLGKGTGNGQAIRDEILNIMHRNNISECNNNFYEQWHQKLHNNTTPDDIVICEALLAFLYSGNIEDYRNTLKRGGVTKERLASYERKITYEPWHNRGYIHDFENYLKILKSVHASTDLVQTYDQCKYLFLGNSYKFEEIIRCKNDSNTINQIRRVTEGREILQEIIKNNLDDHYKLRDALFFELSLESYLRQLVEKIIHLQYPFQAYIEEINLVLRNIKTSFPNYKEFELCYTDWNNIVEKLKNDQSRISSLKIKSVVSRLSRLLSSVIDYYNNYYGAKSKFFGKECGVNDFASSMFAEELMRGSIFFALSMLLKKIEPTLRNNAQLGDWLIISRGIENTINGKLIFIPNLHEVQFVTYSVKTIILTQNISGNEEIPGGCVGLIIIKSDNYPDILSHVSVRARNLNCPFVVCFNDNIAEQMKSLCDKNFELTLMNQEIIFNEYNGDNKEKENESNKNEKEEHKRFKPVDAGKTYKKIYVDMNDFGFGVVGAKSNNTKKICNQVPGCSWIKFPESFAIPFNVNEYFLSLPENEKINEEIEENIKKIKLVTNKSEIAPLLEKCRELTLEIKFVENEETKKLKERLYSFGIKEKKEFDLCFTAIKKVWASKYNERVFIATSKIGITLHDIKMSVLCQKIIPAEYAYVIHTKNPCNDNPNEVYAEVCNGMGEALVGAYEGQAFSFTYNKDDNSYFIKSFQNKSVSLKNQGFIFRSDSNTEDLEGFSGAGLFDSVPMIEDNLIDMTYFNDKLFNDIPFENNLINKISQIGIGIEKLYGEAQDIEGVFYNNEFYVVQTRPQV